MNFVKTALNLVPALGFACALSFAGAAVAQTTTGTMAPAASTMAAKAAKASAAAPAAAAAAAPTAAGQFKTQTEAAASCPGDTVVWASLGKSKAFHLSTSKHFGTTKHGAYECEKAALAAGLHQAKN